jgi:replication fork clamp-binding protein CrfC
MVDTREIWMNNARQQIADALKKLHDKAELDELGFAEREKELCKEALKDKLNG